MKQFIDITSEEHISAEKVHETNNFIIKMKLVLSLSSLSQ